jgi:D-alanine-D-alanine ligase
MSPSTILILSGGPDAERQVSLMSGAAVAEALRQISRFRVIEQVIDRPRPEDLRPLIEREKVHVIFPVLHGRWGEGGALQEVLEELGVTYVGSRPRAAALAMDKLATKMLLAADGVPTPPARQLRPEDDCDLGPPLVLKPVDDGSSVDLRICRTREQIDAGRAELHPRRGRLMAERYIDGRELTVGIVCGEALPLIEIIPSEAVEFYDYQAKYERDDTCYIVAPDVPADVDRRCRELALLAFRRLGCRDLARVDFMLDERAPWLLEVNTIPGFTSHSLVPMAARHVGLDMPALCAKLVDAAAARGEVIRAPSTAGAQSSGGR